MKEKNSCCWYW